LGPRANGTAKVGNEQARLAGKYFVDSVDGFRAVSDGTHGHRVVDRLDQLRRPDRAEGATQLDELDAVGDETPRRLHALLVIGNPDGRHLEAGGLHNLDVDFRIEAVAAHDKTEIRQRHDDPLLVTTGPLARAAGKRRRCNPERTIPPPLGLAPR